MSQWHYIHYVTLGGGHKGFNSFGFPMVWFPSYLVHLGVGIKISCICDLITLFSTRLVALTIQEERRLSVSLLWLRWFLNWCWFWKGKRRKRELEFVPKFNDLITLIIMWTQQIHSKTQNAPFLGHWNKQQRGVFPHKEKCLIFGPFCDVAKSDNHP